jgi:hypothetical protein
MLASTAAIWAIVIVVVLCMATWLSAVAIAARRPYWKHSAKRPMIGPVVGAIHYADGGRSVAPDREAPPVFTTQEELDISRRASGRVTTRPQIPGQPVPGQRTPVSASAGAGAATGPAPDGAAGAGSGAERQPLTRPKLPSQREATQDQPETHRRRPGR